MNKAYTHLPCYVAVFFILINLYALFDVSLYIFWFQELNREEPAGWGGPQADRHVIDSRGVLVEREAVVCRERLTLGHCIVLSVLIVRTSKLHTNLP